MVDLAHFYLSDDLRFDEKAVKKFLTPEVRELLKKLCQLLEKARDFSEKSIEEAFTSILAEENLQLGEIAQPARVALTGSTVSPGIYEVISILGKERTLNRLRAALGKIESAG